MSFRESVGKWGAVVFGALFAFGVGKTLVERFSNADNELHPGQVAAVTTKAPRSQEMTAPLQLQPASAQQHLAAGESDLLTRCIKAALDVGYRDGQCAYSYIDACITTQSKQQMERSLQTDRMLGAVGRGCPNMPTNYSSAFTAAAIATDKF